MPLSNNQWAEGASGVENRKLSKVWKDLAIHRSGSSPGIFLPKDTTATVKNTAIRNAHPKCQLKANHIPPPPEADISSVLTLLPYEVTQHISGTWLGYLHRTVNTRGNMLVFFGSLRSFPFTVWLGFVCLFLLLLCVCFWFFGLFRVFFFNYDFVCSIFLLSLFPQLSLLISWYAHVSEHSLFSFWLSSIFFWFFIHSSLL